MRLEYNSTILFFEPNARIFQLSKYLGIQNVLSKNVYV